MNNLLWGIDLGGTKIEGIAIDSLDPLSTVSRMRIDTEAWNGYNAIIDNVAALIDKLSTKAGSAPKMIGFATPGVLDPVTHLLKNSNTQCFNGKPLQKDLEEKLQLPVRIANDANCFSLAEAISGAGRGEKCVFGVIMGTGVGGGVVIDGQVRYGRQGIAGEWGHNVLDPGGDPCYCGKRGCVERFISGPALQEYYKKLSGTELAAQDIFNKYMHGGDPDAAATIDRLVTFFGKAISAVINILDPDVIVLGGGLSNIPLLYKEAPEIIKKNIFNDKLYTKIVPNQLGDSAGVIGAAMLFNG
jgi:fructokinase